MKRLILGLVMLGLLVGASKGIYKVGKYAGKGVIKVAKVLV